MEDTQSKSPKTPPMKWTDEMDILFRLREILAEEPYQYKPKRKEKGQIWKRIAYNLNTLKEPKFTVNHRSVRDRYNILEKKFKEKEAEERNASGITHQVTEFDQAMHDIIGRMEEAEKTYHKITQEEKEKEEKDIESADEMRRQSLETFAETKKRKAGENENGKPPKRTRATGIATMSYLKESAEKMTAMKQLEYDMQQKQLSQHKEEQNNMMRLLQQQIEQQKQERQQQLLQQQQLQAAMLQAQQQQSQMQQQQMQAFLAFMQKLNET